MSANMVRRVAFAVVAIPALIAIIWLGAWALAVLLVVAASLGTTELFDLAERTGLKPMRGLGQFMAVMAPALLLALIEIPNLPFAGQWGYWLLVGALITVGAGVFLRNPADRPLASIAVTLFAPIYCGVFPAMAFVIRHGEWSSRSWPGTAVVLFPLVTVWICDSAAMLGGQLIGGPKLAPTVSPGKTWAGAISGVVGGCAVGVAFALLVFPRAGIQLGVLPAVALAIAVAIIGQIGDLAESLFKREAGVKDSSSLIPGHGGVLDRLDSLYFAIPVAAAGYHLLGII